MQRERIKTDIEKAVAAHLVTNGRYWLPMTRRGPLNDEILRELESNLEEGRRSAEFEKHLKSLSWDRTRLLCAHAVSCYPETLTVRWCAEQIFGTVSATGPFFVSIG